MNCLMNLAPVLPKGAMREIAEKTGVSYPDVTRMFRGMASQKTQMVLDATRELLNERGIILDPKIYGETASLVV